MIPDARISGKANSESVVEILLSISGEDAVSINRKNRPLITEQLPTRFILLSNIVPEFTDQSGAIASRFIVLRMTDSFLGRENHSLTRSLLTELPGILLWSIDGWCRFAKEVFFSNLFQESPIKCDCEIWRVLSQSLSTSAALLEQIIRL